MAGKKKDWVAKLKDSKDLPKVVKITGKMTKRWGTGTVVIPAPIEVDELMRRVPKGKLTTINEIRQKLAKKHRATIGCPITTGIFAWIAANAAEQERAKGKKRITPYWRTLKSDGSLNPKYPGGEKAQKKLLEAEGHKIVKKGKKYLVSKASSRASPLSWPSRGIFAIYKPKGPTSHDVIDELRRRTGVKKIGHAGTLDPLASGVLVVGVGREATKRLGEVVKKEKEYLAEIKLGETSTTDDEEGEKAEIPTPLPPKPEEVQKAVAKFQGEINQVPPAYSAVKVKGKEAYKLARKGQKPELEPRKMEIKEIEILKYEWPYLKLRVVTGPGVYIRALARDIGQALKTGGYLAELERIRVGDFTLTNE